MRTVPAPLLAAIRSRGVCLRVAVVIKPRNGDYERYIAHHEDVTVALEDVDYPFIDGVYSAAEGLLDLNWEGTADPASRAFRLESFMDAGAISRERLLAGFYDYAEMWSFMIDAANPANGIVKTARGHFGEIDLYDLSHSSELRDFKQRLQTRVGLTWGSPCKATFGDARCGINLALHTFAATVSGVTDRANFATGLAGPDDDYTTGKVVWTSGDNAGLTATVKAFASGGFELMQAMPYEIQIGDGLNATRGCLKRFQEDCIDRYDNAINYVFAAPFMPGTKKILRYPDAPGG